MVFNLNTLSTDLQLDDLTEAAPRAAEVDAPERASLSPSQTALVAADLVKTYGRRRVVDGVSLHVEQGEVVGLLGANGAGKTTTFYMIVGLERPEAGRVRLGKRDITKLPMYLRARLGL
ncbi:MAG TPA: ATP-binding cassette domain-containing protein, partial [Pyrinomonadaceae bacterium]|nr:ATP-binding cassette domain-containing protein [Pyrinomonadaceae bacterium]